MHLLKIVLNALSESVYIYYYSSLRANTLLTVDSNKGIHMRRNYRVYDLVKEKKEIVFICLFIVIYDDCVSLLK